MYKKITAIAMGAAFAVMTASAAIIAQYDAGVAAEAGVSGSANPTSGTGVNAWTFVGGGNQWVNGYDSGNGGWNISDGTSTAAAFYQHSLSGADVALMANGWTVTWSVAANHDLLNSSGGALNDWVLNDRQNNNDMWVETTGYLYRLAVNHDTATGAVSLNDGTATYTVGNNLLSEQLPSGSEKMNYIDFTLVYDAVTDQATLTDGLGGNHGVINTQGSTGFNRIIFGATTGPGMGSTAWNNVTLDAIPEPATLGLVAIFGGAVLFLRRKSML